MRKVNRPLEFESVCSHRREDCIRYAGCLSEASALLWQSFSCDECELYTPADMESLESRWHQKACSPLAWEV
jgi:hypothetical protein